MITYSQFSPTGFDARGLGLPDQQDWLVGPVALNRDSDSLTRSNWEVVTAELVKLGAEIHRFGHWGNGWFEIVLVPPGGEAERCAAEWEAALADYPVANEDHWSELQYREASEYWGHLSLSGRRDECSRAGVSKLAAYRSFGALPDRLTEHLFEEF